MSADILRRVIIPCLCALPFAIILAYGFDPNAKFLGSTSGVVVSLSPPGRVNDGYLDMRVKLSTGSIVLAKGPIAQARQFRLDKNVCLDVYQTLLFRQDRYIVSFC